MSTAASHAANVGNGSKADITASGARQRSVNFPTVQQSHGVALHGEHGGQFFLIKIELQHHSLVGQ
jgi:hypothetical protein